MSSRLQLDVRNLSLGRRHLLNAYEAKAGIDVIVWSMPERLESEVLQQEVKVIWQKAPHGGPIPRLGVTPGGRKLYHCIPGVGFPISVP